MPYDAMTTPGQAPAAAGLEAGGEMDADKGATAVGEGEIHIASDMLPPGIKEGDSLKCTGMDENGCSFELVKGAESKPEGEDWETGFRKEMSAMNPSNEAS